MHRAGNSEALRLLQNCGSLEIMMENIIWSDRVKNEEVLQRARGDNEYPTKLKRWKADWIGHILRANCLPQHAIAMKHRRD